MTHEYTAESAGNNARTYLCATLQLTATHYNLLQLAATHCNSLQHTAESARDSARTHVHTAIHCNTLQLTTTYCNSRQRALGTLLAPICHTATRCHSLKLAAIHCNTFQLTTTHCLMQRALKTLQSLQRSLQ